MACAVFHSEPVWKVVLSHFPFEMALASFVLFALVVAADSQMVYPPSVFANSHQQAGFVDVTRPPFNADATGLHDSSEAIIAAYNTLWDADSAPNFINYTQNGTFQGHCAHRTLYFPKGHYTITREIIYSINRTWDKGPAGDLLDDCIHFQGEGYDTVLFMPSALPACNNLSNPAALISFIPNGGLSNVAMKNSLQDMTMIIGDNNPGCDGLAFQGNNAGAVRRVRIISNSGRIGLRLTNGLTGLSLFKDVYIQGFAIGVASNSTHPGNVLEHIRLLNQTRYGIAVYDNTLTLRDITFDTVIPGAKLAYVGDTGNGMLTLIDTVAKGVGECALDVDAGFLFVRNLTQSGFTSTTCGAQVPHVSDHHLAEFSNAPPIVLCDNCASTTLNLPVKETPELYNPPLTEWVSVQSYGAVAGDDEDDTRAIQAALDSGATLVYLPPNKGIYQVSDSLNISGNLQRLDLFWSVMNVTNPGRPLFNIDQGTAAPLWIHHLNFNGDFSYTVNIRVNRTVVISESQSGAKMVSNDPAATDFTLFIEAVACGSGCHDLTGGSTYARCYDPEGKATKFNQTGGSLWILGFKTENNGTDFRIRSGAHVEVLGGELNRFGGLWATGHPSIDIKDSRATFVAAEFGPNYVELEAVDGSNRRQLFHNDTRITLRNAYDKNVVYGPLVV
eukprot:TRINITY_DN10876_c0_g5_i3.p1 TRINITY_DN10876_c0_g5~~TRINITY_DN10876_c0_g5_i3.p1  ORF type:complete len:672 (+),score=112.39 TRINITY_DN10876_c0_g5_i3:775-2790(+)